MLGFELLPENGLKFFLRLRKARVINFKKNLSDFRKRVTVSGHVLTIVQGILDLKIGLA
jgi:hypothetical protein